MSRMGYAVRNVTVGRKKQITVSMHRVILATPPGMETDHKNQDKLDNRKENLRVCSKAENMRNRKRNKNCKSGVKGVSFHKMANAWIAQIVVDGRKTHLGTFKSIRAAAESYAKAAKKHYGEFHRLA